MKKQPTVQQQLERALVRQRRVHILFERYKEALTIQGALLQLSELASNISDMSEFYPAIHQMVSEQLHAENFYVVFYDQDTSSYSLQYFSDEKDQQLIASVPSSAFSRGLTGYVVKHERPLLCDEQQFERLVASGEIEVQGSPSTHWMGIPLWRDQRVIGVMAIQSYDPAYRYNEQDLKLFNNIGSNTVKALERVKSRELLEKTVQQRTIELQQTNTSLQKEVRERIQAERLQAALYKISELTSSSQDMPTFYHAMHQVLLELMPAENCYIALLNPDNTGLTFPYYIDQYNPVIADRPLGKGYTEYVIHCGETKLISIDDAKVLADRGDILHNIHALDRSTYTAVSWLGAPLTIDKKVIGVIAVQSYEAGYYYTDHELSILRFVSQHIAVAIQRKLASEKQRQHQEELERKVFESTRELRQTNLFLRLQVEERKKAEQKLFYDANHDNLTGLANRQMFLQQLKQQFALNKRQPQFGMALLFLDLDRFKLINDSLGHHIGDAFLIESSKRLQSAIREHDVAARFGGDEFVVMLLNLNSLQDAEDIAQRVIDKFRQPYLLDGHTVKSGVSIGIAPMSLEYHHADAMLRDADAAMYHAKALGRGRYAIFQTEMREQMLQALSN